MGSVPDARTLQRCGQIIGRVVKRIALEQVLPWHLSELQTAAFDGVRITSDKHTDSLGLPFEQQAQRWIVEKTAAKGSDLRAKLASEDRRQPPSEGRIEAALKFFSAEEWRRLIGAFDGRDTGTLWIHVDRNRGRLERDLGKNKLYTVFDAISGRYVELLCMSGPWRKTVITDAMWATYWTQMARRRNVNGEPRPSEKRSLAETGRPNNIAESLTRGEHKVSPYKVRKMLKRTEGVPFEEFDGSWWDYLTWATDPKAYRRLGRRAGKRDP